MDESVGHRVELNPGEMFFIADPTILVDEYESIIADVSKIGAPSQGPTYLLTFAGKLNNKDKRSTVTVALPVESAFELTQAILDGLELLMKANKNVDEWKDKQ